MPPLLPDEATKAQETFRLGDRFYVEEHGLVLGELIGINDTWIRRRFAIKDCNTAIAGAYNVDDSTTNNFPTGAYKFGTLLVANSGFFGSQYFVPDNFNVDPYIYIRSISNNGNSFNKWAKIKVTIIT